SKPIHQTPFPCRKYAAISSSEQRQSYKNDFNAEYSEYRDLHARIERITRRFTQLDAKLKQLLQGSEEYKVEPELKTPQGGSPCT
ncbi:ELL factor, partial [Promerops cafer]|nr:ELL factor [Promerops cafer]